MTRRSAISRLRSLLLIAPRAAALQLPAPSKRERKRIVLGIDQHSNGARVVRAMDPIANQNMRHATGNREAARNARRS